MFEVSSGLARSLEAGEAIAVSAKPEHRMIAYAYVLATNPTTDGRFELQSFVFVLRSERLTFRNRRIRVLLVDINEESRLRGRGVVFVFIRNL